MNNINNHHDAVIPLWFQAQCVQIQDENCQIRNLNLNIRRLNPSMIVALAEALDGNTSIEVINMTSSLTMAAAQESNHSAMLLPLAMAIQQRAVLKQLHLSYNRLADVSSLQCCIHTLTELHLDHNHLKAETAMALAKALPHNNTSLLQVLVLNSNRLSDAGGVALAKALRHNTTLHTLGLRHNALGIETGNAMFETLQGGNVTLKHLDLSSNPASSSISFRKCVLMAQANRFGRYLLFRGKKAKNDNYLISGKIGDGKEEHHDDEGKLWPFILAKTPPHLLFYFLVEKPDLVPSSMNR
jgi:Leucine Rich repeat